MISAVSSSTAIPPKSCLKRKHDELLDGDFDNHKSKMTKTSSESNSDSTDEGKFSESMYRAYVHDALDQFENRNPEPLNTLGNQIQLPSSSSETLTTNQLQYIIISLTSEISRLDSNAGAAIISSILKLKWSNRGDGFVNAYVRFLGVLVSGIPKWWTEVANKVVTEFILENTEAHHSILSYLLSIIPTASGNVQSVFVKHFPHKSDPTHHLTRYVDNLLRSIEYCPEVQTGVWSLIIERTVQLDVELYEDVDEEEEEEDEDDDEEEDEEDEDEDEEGGSALSKTKAKAEYGTDKIEAVENEESDEEDFDDNASDVSEYQVEEEASRSIAIVRKKLDAIMCRLFEYLDEKFTLDNILKGRATPLFTMLVDLFKKFILPTHRTRSIQYLMFRICHAHNQLLDAFLVALIELALDPAEDMERRQKAMQYISSFIARAKGLSRQQIVFVVSLLGAWLERYVDEREIEVDNEPGGMGRFKMFYAVSQALFYIFCFRHSILRRQPKNNDEDTTNYEDAAASLSEWEGDLDKLFQRIIVTKFNPLKYCKRTVVAMFAQIAEKERAAYCFTILEQNRLGGFRSVAESPLRNDNNNNNSIGSSRGYFSGAGSFWAKNQEFVTLEGYFPFDPLILRKARSKLADIYVEWDDVAEDFDSGSEVYEEEEEDDDDDDGKEEGDNENDGDSDDD